MIAKRVKICGITNEDDAIAAVDMGADMIGFNFYEKSSRYITPQKALAIIKKLPTFIDTVGVFVNASIERVKETAEECWLNWVQLHGDETPEFCDSLKWLNARTIKAIRVKSGDDIKRAELYFTDAVLFDAYDAKNYGGTGKTFDWSLIDNVYKRIIVAGGLTAQNAATAIELGFYGIDVCSGIESEPGKKDHKKMKQLFENIRHVRN